MIMIMKLVSVYMYFYNLTYRKHLICHYVCHSKKEKRFNCSKYVKNFIINPLIVDYPNENC